MGCRTSKEIRKDQITKNMHLGLTKSRDDKLLQDLLDKKLRVIVVFEDDYLNHIARIAYKDIQQDNYTYRIGKYNIYKGEEWGFYNFCKRNDCYFIVPNETIEGGSSETTNDLEEAAKEFAKTTFKKPYSDNPDEEVTIVEPDKYAGFIAGAKWDREQMMSKAVEGIARPDDCEIWVNLVGYGYKFNDGDKVRIIIVKED